MRSTLKPAHQDIYSLCIADVELGAEVRLGGLSSSQLERRGIGTQTASGFNAHVFVHSHFVISSLATQPLKAQPPSSMELGLPKKMSLLPLLPPKPALVWAFLSVAWNSFFPALMGKLEEFHEGPSINK